MNTRTDIVSFIYKNMQYNLKKKSNIFYSFKLLVERFYCWSNFPINVKLAVKSERTYKLFGIFINIIYMKACKNAAYFSFLLPERSNTPLLTHALGTTTQREMRKPANLSQTHRNTLLPCKNLFICIIVFVQH